MDILNNVKLNEAFDGTFRSIAQAQADRMVEQGWKSPEEIEDIKAQANANGANAALEMREKQGWVKWDAETVMLEIISRTGAEINDEYCSACCDWDGEECQCARDDDFPRLIGEDPICPQEWTATKSLATALLAALKEAPHE